MSLRVDIDSLTDELREKITNDLTVSPEAPQKFKPSFYATRTPPVELFQVEDNYVIVPFSYGISELGLKKPKNSFYEKQNPSLLFTGTLRDTTGHQR